MYTLYFHPVSGNSRKATFLLEHLGLAFHANVIDLFAGEQRSPEFLAMNPMGMVPVLRDQDITLPESNAILRHVARTHAPELEGRTPRERADVDRWMSWQLAHFGPAMTALNLENTIKPATGGGAPDPDTIARLRATLDVVMVVLETHLAGSPGFLCGDVPTLADFAMGPNVDSTPLSGVTYEAYPAIQAWLDRLRAMKGWSDMPSPRG